MPDITPSEMDSLREVFTELSPGLALALSEHRNEMTELELLSLEEPAVHEILSRSETALSTLFSLSAPFSVESLLVMSEEDAKLLANNSEEEPPESLTEAQNEELGVTLAALVRGLATNLTNRTGENVEVESCVTSIGALSLPPVFALSDSALQANFTLSIPGKKSLTITLLITPELVHLLAPAQDEIVNNAADDIVSEDDLAAMLSEISGSESEPAPVQGSSGGAFASHAALHQNMPNGIELLLDIPLEVTVELGRVKMLIRDVLELASGSIVELDRMAGEPVDLQVNGKLVAKGEVVVIEDNFGIRVTEIISPIDRVSSLGKVA